MTSSKSEHFSPQEQSLIHEEAAIAERQGRWTAKMYQLAFRKDLFRKMVPECYGGQQVSLPLAMEIVEEAAALDGSFGWTLTLGMGAGIFGAYLEPEMAARTFAKPDAYIAGSGSPDGSVEPTGKGFRLKGRWKYITGSDIATAFTAALPFPDGNKERVRAVILEPSQVRIEHTWSSYGLVATASHDQVVRNLEIDSSRIFDLVPGTARVDAPLYAYPFLSMATAHIAACAMGVVKGFAEAAEEILEQRDDSERLDALAKHRQPFVQQREAFLNLLQQSWEQVDQRGEADPQLLESMENAAVEAVQTGLSSAHKIYALLGMSVLDKESRANRAWRDLLTATQHTLLNKKS